MQVVSPGRPAAHGRVLPALFEASLRRWPGAVAVDIPPAEGRVRHTVTYAALDAQAGSLARQVARLTGPGDIVAVLLPRTNPRLHAGQLGILRAGCAHVCLDPVFPDEQLGLVLADSAAPLLLTDSAGERRARGAGYRGRVLRVDRPVHPPTRPLRRAARPHEPAYLVHTSGTTGRPKGVMISHHAITGLIASDVPEFRLAPGDRVAQCSSSAFDSSIEETWMAWASGAALVVLDDDTVRLGPDLVPWLRDEAITVFCPPPTLLRTTACANPERELPDLRLLYVGGEALPSDVAEAWAPGRRLVNGYGPTECTVTCLRQDISPGHPIAIGRPVPGMTAWVLDADLEPVPDGEPGELCMSGAGLAMGYLDDRERTAARFPHHPRLGRLYRTGDLVHRAPDGSLVHHGRIDSQVKLRGYRIELEAVETALARCPQVREAACRIQGQGAASLLAAHVVPADPLRPPVPGELARRLREALPRYMVPTRYGTLDELPKAVSGKIRRDALPVLDPPRHDPAPVPSEPVDAVTRSIADAAGRVLGVAHAALDADFFHDLGGTSLHAAMLISELRADPATRALTVRDVYQARTLAELARTGARPAPATTCPEPSAPAARPDAGNALTATALQSAWLAAELLALSVSAALLLFRLAPALVQAVGLTTLLLAAPLAAQLLRLLLAPAGLLAAVAAKKILVGRYRPETVGVWSGRAIRMWMVRQVVRLVPWRSLAGTEYQCAALRALGARIGARVHIHRGVDLQHGGWDLLSLGDDVTVGQDASLRLMSLHRRQVVVGPVVLEEGAAVDVRAGVGPGARLGAGSWLTALSCLPPGAAVPDGALADGVPARVTGQAPAVPEPARGARELSPRAHGAVLLLGHTLLRALVTLPYGLAAVVLVHGFGLTARSAGAAPAHPAHHPALSAAALAAVCAAQVGTLVLEATAARALGAGARAATLPRHGLAYIRVRLASGLVDSAGNWLSGTLMWPRWLRAAGMTVEADCEISTVIDVVPALTAIGRGSFLADGVYLGGPRLHRGTVTLAPVSLGRGTFIGNHAVLPAGRSLPDGVLIGIATPLPPEPVPGGSAWFGHPAFALPRREVVTAERHFTHTPSAVQRADRWMWETARFALPAVVLAGAGAWVAGVRALTGALPDGWGLLAAPTATTGLALASCATVLALKWILLGRVRPGEHPLWTGWCSRWDFLYVAWRVIAARYLTALEGTLLLPVYLRRMGMRIGRRVALGEGFAQVVDPDMLHIGDGATVSAMFQAHTFEDRVLKIDHIHVGNGATLADSTVPLYGATIGQDATVAPHSVVMKREHLLPGIRYEGAPTAPSPHAPVSGERQSRPR